MEKGSALDDVSSSSVLTPQCAVVWCVDCGDATLERPLYDTILCPTAHTFIILLILWYYSLFIHVCTFRIFVFTFKQEIVSSIINSIAVYIRKYMLTAYSSHIQLLIQNYQTSITYLYRNENWQLFAWSIFWVKLQILFDVRTFFRYTIYKIVVDKCNSYHLLI